MEPVDLPDCLTPFKLQNGQLLYLDLVDAASAINRIGKECDEAQLTNFEYVYKFRDWVKESTDCELNPAQTLFIIKHINKELAAGKDGGEPPPN